MKTFGSILREARRGRRKTLEDVARAIGCTKSHVSAFESGKNPPPSPQLIRKAARYLGLDRGRLLAFALLDRLPEGLTLRGVEEAIAEIRQDVAAQAQIKAILALPATSGGAAEAVLR